jgi:hypothetical protein
VPGPTRARRELLLAAAELLALSGAAVAQPLLDQFGRAPDVFLRAGASRADLWWFALAVAFVPPFLLIAVEVTTRAAAGERAHRWLHRSLLAVLVAAFAGPLLRLEAGWEGPPVVAGAIVAAAAFVALHAAFPVVRQWLAFASVLPVVAVALFLFAAPVSDLARPGQTAAPAIQLTAASQETPIVFVVFDEFPVSALLTPSGEIDAARYPRFAELATGARWYRNATTVSTHTDFAVPAMLTGRYPENGLRPALWTEYPDNLFRLLAGSYDMRVDEYVTQLCPAEHCPAVPATASTATGSGDAATAEPDPPPDASGERGLASLFALVRDELADRLSSRTTERVVEATLTEELASTTSTTQPISPAELPDAPTTTTGTTSPDEINWEGLQRVAGAQPARFVEFLAGMQSGEPARTLHFLHLLVPHVPWHITADGFQYQYSEHADVQFPGYNWRWETDAAGIAARQRLVLQAGYTDSLVGLMIDRLRETGLWDDAIVIVTADHGIAFTKGASMRGIEAGPSEMLGVPLFVRARGLEAGVDDRPAQTVDIVPTIADLLGIEMPWPVDGISLLGTARIGSTHPVGVASFGHPVELVDVDVGGHLDALRSLAPPRNTEGTSTEAQADGGRDLEMLRSWPHGELIGRPAGDVLAGADPDRAVALEFPDEGSFDRVDVTQPLPLHVVGSVDGGTAGDLVVVIVNGRVAGVAEVFTDHVSPARFTAMLDRTAFRAGANDVSFGVLPGAARSGSSRAAPASSPR